MIVSAATVIVVVQARGETEDLTGSQLACAEHALWQVKLDTPAHTGCLHGYGGRNHRFGSEVCQRTVGSYGELVVVGVPCPTVAHAIQPEFDAIVQPDRVAVTYQHIVGDGCG